MGLSESAAEFFPEAAWQRCIVHWYRNIFSHVPSTKVREIAAMLKAIHASEDIVAGFPDSANAFSRSFAPLNWASSSIAIRLTQTSSPSSEAQAAR
jgi:transposase-like protein